MRIVSVLTLFLTATLYVPYEVHAGEIYGTCPTGVGAPEKSGESAFYSKTMNEVAGTTADVREAIVLEHKATQIVTESSKYGVVSRASKLEALEGTARMTKRIGTTASVIGAGIAVSNAINAEGKERPAAYLEASGAVAGAGASLGARPLGGVNAAASVAADAAKAYSETDAWKKAEYTSSAIAKGAAGYVGGAVAGTKGADLAVSATGLAITVGQKGTEKLVDGGFYVKENFVDKPNLRPIARNPNKRIISE